MTARLLSSIAQVEAASWNALVGNGQPFLRHEFLLALEDSGCTVPRTGWTVRHLVIDDARGRPVGARDKVNRVAEAVFDRLGVGV